MIADVRKHLVEPGAASVTFRKSFVRCDRSKVLAVNYKSLTLPLTWSACNYGSQRPWFVCRGCGQRVVKLYQHWSTTRYDDWRCRRCLELTYASCQKSNSEDAFWHRREQAIAKFRRAIGDPNWHPVPDPFAIKPKGMHWKPYERLRHEVYDAEAETLRLTQAKLAKMTNGSSAMPRESALSNDLVQSIQTVSDSLDTAFKYMTR